MKNVSCVDQLCSVKHVPNFQTVSQDLPVGAKPVLGYLGSPGGWSKTLTNAERGLHPPFRTKPNLTRSATIISCYVSDHRNLYLIEALHQLINKNAVELVKSLGFYNRLFLVRKESVEAYTGSRQPQQIPQGRKIQNGDIRNNKDLPQNRGVGNVHRLQGCLLPHTNCKPAQEVPERLHVQGQTYQFKALVFGLSTAPMEFTIVAKEVKLMALQICIRIHQYLDDWLVWARSHQTCLQHTQTLVAICQDLGWLLNREKSELDPKQVFNFIG